MKIESMTCDTVNMCPASAVQGIPRHLDRGLSFSFLLGTDYERRKQKLKQELQLDYKNSLAMKKDLKTRESPAQREGLSLPIDENKSAKEKLREERNREYNLFLQEKAQTRRLKRAPPPVTSKSGQFQASDAACISSPASHQPILNTHTNIPPPFRERPASRRDAATLTDALGNGKRAETWERGYQGRRRWQIYRPKELYSSEEEQITDKEEELDFRHRRKKHMHSPEPVYKEERRIREHRANRAPLDIRRVEAPGVHDQNNNDRLLKLDLQMPDSRMTARSRPATSKDKVEFATGLLIGATEEQTAIRMRKEQYMQELQKQIAEQQRNKMREKTLELRVAVTGATDPEKKPDRLKQFAPVNRQYDNWIHNLPNKLGMDPQATEKDPNSRPKDNKPTEDTEQRGPPGFSQKDYSPALSQLAGNTIPGSGMEAAQGAPSLDYFSMDYHRDFSNMLGEVDIPKVADVPPPVPPTVTNNYKTPYDAAYFYYGTRDPLNPDLPHYQNDLPGRVQQSGTVKSPPRKAPPVRPSHCTEAAGQYRASPLDVREFPEDKSKQRKESVLSYQEALKQQIKEREERRRREKEEKERYDAKIEAEMKAYNPWGRSGGGAPIKDQNGNLFHDSNQRNRINKESYQNLVFKSSEQTQNSLVRNGDTPGDKASSPISDQLSGFKDQTIQQPLPVKDRYREALQQQMEENKRKREEERERMRMEEEKEERRMAEQRARIQQEYEEEKRKQKRTEHRLENHEWLNKPKINGPTTQLQDKEKKRKPEQETGRKVPEYRRDREEKEAQLSYELQREPSPPVPALQRKQTNLVVSRPLSVQSQLSSRTERTMSAPHYQAVPMKIPQQQEDHQEVIKELSALRRYLRNEQKQLEIQLGQTEQQENHYTPLSRPRRRPRVDAFESGHRVEQPSTTRTHSDAARVNMQNIREFNQLKYRDTSSRKEVLHMYPDPPTDAQSLDIQQQALLREQQRKIKLMKREEEDDSLDWQQSHYYHRNKPQRFIHRDSILPSETVFMDVYSGDACEEEVPQQRFPQPTAQHQKSTAQQRRHDDDRKHEAQPDTQSLQSSNSLTDETTVRARNNQHFMRQNTGAHNSKSVLQCGDEGDVSSIHSALEGRVSVETVATEPWLRPGTSAAVKRSARRERPNRGKEAPPWLTDDIR